MGENLHNETVLHTPYTGLFPVPSYRELTSVTPGRRSLTCLLNNDVMRAIAFDVTEQGSGYIRRWTPQHQQSPLTTWAFTSRGFASTPPQPESWTSPLSWWSCPASSLWPSSSWRVSLRPRGSGAPVWEESEAQSADRRTSSATYRSTWPPVSRGPSWTPSPSSPPSPTSSTTVSDKLLNSCQFTTKSLDTIHL